MARPKRKNRFRRIVIDGANFVWRAGIEHTGYYDLEVLLDGETSAKGSRLCVSFFAKSSPYQNPVDVFPCDFDVTPRLVARIVKDVLSQGWQPSELLAPWFRKQVVIENGEPISYADL
jgi:hypothetical protein